MTKSDFDTTLDSKKQLKVQLLVSSNVCDDVKDS